MKIQQFKCTLLSDVIINQKAATEGMQQTLDFIPGSNFLGVAAAELYKETVLTPEDAALVFHTGKFRFGDAHPAHEGARALRVPAMMYHPKQQKETEECYISHRISDETLWARKQLKQCRTNFYAFTTEQSGQQVNIPKTFAIKSAYDNQKRRSKDEAMYGYQSIDKGAEFYFELEADDSIVQTLFDQVVNALVGAHKHVGRSRTAQYGLVQIEKTTFTQPRSASPADEYVTVYADGRLVFLDKNGLPTFQPTIEQLGFASGTATICAEHSQIRTFQYAPWNFKRQARDTDRCGIEKGSVWVLKAAAKDCPTTSQYVGSYLNEGFGKVIYNPVFLQAEPDGKAKCKLNDAQQAPTRVAGGPKCTNQAVVQASIDLKNYLHRRKKAEELENEAYRLANQWANDFGKRGFIKEAFASQWGSIRNIAMQQSGKKELVDAILHYISHGVASKRWKDERREKLKLFMENLSDDVAQLTLVNLASIMSKKCSKNTKGGKRNG
ncbi:hypothetical protein LJC21_00450 [Bacteroides sp. OttesenSCG-928-E20]|nr:hypothetical protein [Bacteroides sp. OttesenSCG-928-N06]MDL2299163.1 hypothetical protein [Bacteroides sp. OttesenSCG-928-E20]MDL2304650.1 hypothetical protein [Bacteroides sp. OttesenSCG-928-D19]